MLLDRWDTRREPPATRGPLYRVTQALRQLSKERPRQGDSEQKAKKRMLSSFLIRPFSIDLANKNIVVWFVFKGEECLVLALQIVFCFWQKKYISKEDERHKKWGKNMWILTDRRYKTRCVGSATKSQLFFIQPQNNRYEVCYLAGSATKFKSPLAPSSNLAF